MYEYRAVVRSVHDADDKYGRLLATVLAPGNDGDTTLINQQLINAGHAKAYDGGTR